MRAGFVLLRCQRFCDWRWARPAEILESGFTQRSRGARNVQPLLGSQTSSQLTSPKSERRSASAGSQSGGEKPWAYGCEACALATTAGFWQNHLTCVTEFPITEREGIVTPALLAPPRCHKVQSPHGRTLVPQGETVWSEARARGCRGAAGLSSSARSL